MLKEHFVWFCMPLHLTGLLTYFNSFPNIMLWKRTNFVSLQYITSFWIWNCFSANWKGKYENWFSCDILESLNQKKIRLNRKRWWVRIPKRRTFSLSFRLFFSQLFSLFIFAYVTAIYDLSFTSCLVELSSKEMIKDSEEMSASLKQQISVFSRLVHWINSLLINTVATMT